MTKENTMVTHDTHRAPHDLTSPPHAEHHVHGGPKVYGAILAALIFLTVVTVGASYVNWGSGMANVVIAMLIASLKASLVALFFMHLRWDKPISAITFVASLFFLGLFLIGCYGDLISRPPSEPVNMKVKHAPGGQYGPYVPSAPGAVAEKMPGSMPAVPGAPVPKPEAAAPARH